MLIRYCKIYGFCQISIFKQKSLQITLPWHTLLYFYHWLGEEYLKYFTPSWSKCSLRERLSMAVTLRILQMHLPIHVKYLYSPYQLSTLVTTPDASVERSFHQYTVILGRVCPAFSLLGQAGKCLDLYLTLCFNILIPSLSPPAPPSSNIYMLLPVILWLFHSRVAISIVLSS